MILKDQSPNGNDGAIMGRADLVDGKIGKALDLSGHDEWVEFYRAPSLDITEEITLELWVKPRKFIHTNYFLSKGNHAFGLIQKDAKTIEFFIHGSERYSATSDIPSDWENEWHHLVGIFNGKEMKLYVDGALKATHAYDGKILDSPFPVTIGRDSENHDSETNGMLSNAIIDEVRIYNKAVPFDQLNDQKPEDAVLSLDFEGIEQKGHFYMTGLEGRTYGLVWADRSIQPEMWQVKKSAQPVQVAAVNLVQGKVKLTNWFNFTNLDELELRYSIGEANEPATKMMTVSLAPHQSKIIEIPLDGVDLGKDQNIWLNISFITKEGSATMPKGHEVAWEQFQIKNKKIGGGWVIYPPTSAIKMNIEKTQNMIIITGNHFSYSFDKSTGQLCDMKYKGKDFLEKGPLFNIWRAPLANDIDPWNNWQHRTQEKTDGLGRSRDNHWRTLGIEQLEYELDGIEVFQLDEITAIIRVNETAYTSTKEGGFSNTFTYQVNAAGEISVEVTSIARGKMPQWLPRIGLQFQLPQELQNVAWYGRGPQENYPDRKSGYKIGTYQSTVDEMYVPYLIPQDYGNRSDVRFVKLTDDAGLGLEIESVDEPFNFSAQNFTTDNLERAMYPFQLKKADKVFLNIDHKVNGLGDTSLATLQEHRVVPGTYEFSFVIKPVQ
jgi:beta-galactosidase